MSGRTKRILYEVFETVLGLSAVAGTVVLAFFGIIRDENQLIGCTIALLIFGISCLVLPFNVLIHECGHMLFGGIAGLRHISVSIGRIQICRRKIRFTRGSSFAGETQMLPRSQKGVRGKMICFALGGALLNLIYAAVFLILFFALPMHPVSFFFELWAALNLFEGITALVPVELEAGRTDGKVLAELVSRTPYSKVFLAALTAQGLLYKKTYAQIPRELLFDLPVVREDEPAFIALTQLRWQYLFSNGDKEGAAAQIKRLETLADYLSEEEKYAEVLCDVAYGYSVLLSNDAHAEELLPSAQAACGTPAHALAQYAVAGGEEKAVRLVIEKESVNGIKEFQKMLLDRAKDKKNSALKQN